MAGQVHPVGVRPLLFKRSVNYVKIVVHREPALDGNIYTVLFLRTGESSDSCGQTLRPALFSSVSLSQCPL